MSCRAQLLPLSCPVVKTCYTWNSSDQMFLTITTMNKLRIRHLSFTQLRFHWPRLLTAPIKPRSSASVVTWVSTWLVWLAAFVRIENDNSMLARVCKRWGSENCFIEVGSGGGHDEDRLCNHAAYGLEWVSSVCDSCGLETMAMGSG